MRFLLCLLLIAFLSTALAAQTVALEDLLKSNSYPITVSNKRLSGDGAKFLISAIADAQFVTIGEPHNVKQVPELTAMLFKDLHEQHGFNYLALEIGSNIAQMFSSKETVGKRDAVIALARQYPNALQFTTDQELEMLAQAGGISDGKGNRIWGLDQAFGALDTLERLVKLAPTKEAHERTQELVKVVREYEGERFAKNIFYMSQVAAKSDDFVKLAELYRPKKNSEAEFLLDQLVLSSRIYRNNALAGTGQPTGYDSNLEREENMKSLFMSEYRRAQAAGDPLPKVLLKFGHWHTIRGINWGNVFTLGNFVSDFAHSNGTKTFSLALYRNNAAGDYGVLSASPDFKPLADVADKDKWTVVDLRPLRKFIHAGQIKGASAELKRMIFGFDAALLIGGAERGTYNLSQTPNFKVLPTNE